MDDFTMNVSQAKVAASVPIGHTPMVVSHEMQNCRVQVVD